MAEKVVPIITPAAPATPSREDRKIVHRKVMEVYVGETHYSGDWSDQKVAGDLGVPAAWVATIREEFFGPDANEQAGKLTEARALLVQIEAGIAGLAPVIQQFQELTELAKQTRAALLSIDPPGERP